MKTFLSKLIKFILNHFTLAKFMGAILTALFVGGIKYYISGNFHLEYSDL
jgi:hypothetical protein